MGYHFASDNLEPLPETVVVAVNVLVVHFPGHMRLAEHSANLTFIHELNEEGVALDFSPLWTNFAVIGIRRATIASR